MVRLRTSFKVLRQSHNASGFCCAVAILFCCGSIQATTPNLMGAERMDKMLEAQGESQRLLERLQKRAERPRPTLYETPTEKRENLRRRLRLMMRLRRHTEASKLMKESGDLLNPMDRQLILAILGLRTQHPEAAILALRDPQSFAPALSNYAFFLLAEAHHGLKQWTRALESIDHIALNQLPTEMRRRLRMIEGHAALGVNDLKRLHRIAGKLVRDARSDDRNGLILYQLARSSMQGERKEQAMEWMRGLLNSRPAPADSAYFFLDRLASKGNAVNESAAADQLQLSRYEIKRRRYRDTRRRLRLLLKNSSLAAEHRGEAWAIIAESYQRQGLHTKCIATLQQNKKVIRGTESEPEMLRMHARSTKRLGNEDEAIALYRDLAKRFPGHPRADDALYEVGWRYEIREEFAAAEKAYGQLARTFPRSQLADDAMLRQGLSAFRAGHHKTALSQFKKMARRHPESNLLPRALYWRLWIHLQQGSHDEAHVVGRRLIKDYPYSYYAVLAAEQLGKPPRPQPENAWLSSSESYELGLSSHKRYWESVRTLRHSPRMKLGRNFSDATPLWRFLLDHGIDVHALWETKRLENQFRRKPAPLLELLVGCYSRGLHAPLVRISYMLSLLLPDPALKEAIAILRYPVPFSVTLGDMSRKNGISHAAVLALMRHESAFNPRIDSPAGARGLMQLMPAIGRKLARRLGQRNMHVDELYDPMTNMKLGCLLLSEELKRARGSWPQALAAYNAGGNPAALWSTRVRDDEPSELYLDVAEYYETRSYIERVLGSYEAYRRLYDLP